MSLPKQIEHPTFTVTLPSNKKKVKVRPMIVKDEKILLMAKTTVEEDNAEILSAIKQITQNCIVDQNVDVDLLPLFDVEYLFLKIRALSVDNKSKVSYRDGEDGEVYEVEIDLNAIEIEMPKNVANKVELSDTTAIMLKYPSASLYNEKGFLKMEGLDAYEELMLHCLDKYVDGDSVTPFANETRENIVNFISQLDLTAYSKIRDFISQIPRLKSEVSYTNSKGTVRKIPLAGILDFFQF